MTLLSSLLSEFSTALSDLVYDSSSSSCSSLDVIDDKRGHPLKIEEIMARWANFARSGEPQVFTDGSSSDTWEPVNPGLVGSLEIVAKAASDPAYLYITGSGGTMVKSNKDKTKQCATIVPNLVGFSYSDSEYASSGRSDTTANTAIRLIVCVIFGVTISGFIL